MVVKMSSPGRSFGGVADYCLHDPRMPGEAHHPESAERVEWTATRNLATSEGERAGRIMAATAEASQELKRLAGVAATGRKLEKPVCHYSLSWAKDEKPDRQEMRWAAQESLKALGMERHQALVVSHRDGQPHVHVIANRVDPESGKAAGLNRSKLKLSKWAEEYERVQGKIRCPQRERNNARRGQGKRVQDRVSRPTGRHRRAEMNPQREQREAIPAGRDGWGGPDRERVAWKRAEERWGVGAASEAAWPGARGTGETEQAGVVGALRASPAAAGILGERLPRGAGALQAMAGAGRQSARDRRGDPGRQGSAGTLPGGVGGPATLGPGFVGKRAFRSGAGDREQGGRILPRGPGRVGETGAGCGGGRTGSQCVTVGVVTNLTHSSTRCWRSGWSRCGRSTESWLTGR